MDSDDQFDELKKHISHEADRMEHRVSGEADRVKEHVSGEADRVEHRVSGEADRVKEHVSGEADRVEHRVSGEADRVKEHVSGEADRVEHRVSGEADRVKEHVSREAEVARKSGARWAVIGIAVTLGLTAISVMVSVALQRGSDVVDPGGSEALGLSTVVTSSTPPAAVSSGSSSTTEAEATTTSSGPENPSTTVTNPPEPPTKDKAELVDFGGIDTGLDLGVTNACVCTGIGAMGNLKVKPFVSLAASSPEVLDIGLSGDARPVLVVDGEPANWDTPWKALTGMPMEVTGSRIADVWAIPANPDSKAELLYSEGGTRYYTFATHWPSSLELDPGAIAYDDGIKTWNLAFSVPLEGGSFVDGYMLGLPTARILGLGMIDRSGRLVAYQRFDDWNGWGSKANEF